MPLSKKKAAVLVGLLAIGMSWQAATTAKADEIAEDSANPSVSVAATNEATPSQATSPVKDDGVTSGQTSSQTATEQDQTAPSQVETENTQEVAQTGPAPASAAVNSYDSSNYGAQLPYTTYEAEDAQLANGANQQASDDVDSTAVEASNQKYVELPHEGSSVTFQVQKPANALNVRYTIPDGTTGQLDVQVNGNSVATLDLNSASSWQYLVGDKEQDSASEGARARFRFDEAHTLLNNVQLQAGDKITLVKKKGDNVAYGIDFIELEEDQGPKAQPENSISITDKGAVANDGQDDSQALLAAIADAQSTGKNVYIPAGQFDLAQKIHVNASNMKISGAGIWHTNLHFTSDQVGGGGFEFDHNDNGLEISDFFTDSNLTSRYSEAANYKAIAGTLGKDSSIHDFWEQHFETGMWIGDYDASNMHYTDGLTVKDSRIRNNLADGINFAQGTKNSTVQNSNIRGNGDDGLASWSSRDGASNASMDENNKYLNNTIELGWRAGGVGIFGGKGHEVANNLIKDNFAGAGVRISTVFPGYNFDNNDTGISVHDNLLYRTGTSSDLYNQERGAIDFQTANGDIKNVTIKDNKLLNSFGKNVNAINANFDLPAQGNGDIHLDGNTIDTTAQLANQATSPQVQDSAPADQAQGQESTQAQEAPSQEPSQAPAGESNQPAPQAETQPGQEEPSDQNSATNDSESEPSSEAQAQDSAPAEKVPSQEPSQAPAGESNQSADQAQAGSENQPANQTPQAQPSNEEQAQNNGESAQADSQTQPGADNQAPAQGQDQVDSAQGQDSAPTTEQPADPVADQDKDSDQAQAGSENQASEQAPTQSESPADQGSATNDNGQAQSELENSNDAQSDPLANADSQATPSALDEQAGNLPAHPTNPAVPQGSQPQASPEPSANQPRTPAQAQPNLDQPVAGQATSQPDLSNQDQASKDSADPANQATPSAQEQAVSDQTPSPSSENPILPDSSTDASKDPSADNQTDQSQKSPDNLPAPRDSAQMGNASNAPSGSDDLPNSPSVPGKGSRPASNQAPTGNPSATKTEKKSQTLPETGDHLTSALLMLLGFGLILVATSLHKHQID
ncbi:right-handed parallel beta-helix repeat-containing protein [Streptococcus downei]|uniref:right-handed parallel beta-helix repeat-containing protein n=1 Tax=Streptococcus downei TaxID=1317 RepID=UPI000E1BE1A8|nr:right-handed parallel beta-helix repeat-containing protein [Streptococcus downei]